MVKRFLVVLVDREHGHVYRYDTQTHHLISITDLVDDVPKTVKSASWKGLADDKINRHIDAHLHEHFKRILESIERAEQPHNLNLILGGPEEVVSQFQAALPKAWEETVVAVIHPDNHVELKDLESKVTQAIQRVAEFRMQDLVHQIEESAEPGGRGVFGEEPVYEALNLRQVQLLLLEKNQAYPGAYCPTDKTFSANQSICSVCLKSMQTVPNLRDLILERAADQAAEVVVVDQDGLLKKYQSIVALRRYA